MGQVEKLEHAAQALRQEAKDADLPVPAIRMWLVSTGGFTGEVLEHARGRGDLFLSDHEGINPPCSRRIGKSAGWFGFVNPNRANCELLIS